MLNALLWNLLLTAGLAIVLAAMCRLPSMHRRPALRYWLWLLLVVKLITPPLVAVPLLPAVTSNVDAAAVATAPSQPMRHHELALEQRIQANPAVDGTTSVAVDEGAEGGAIVVASPEIQAGVQVPYFAVLLAVSLIGTCVLLTVHGVRAAKLYRWIKRAGAENSLLAESCADVASSLGIRGVVRSCVVDTHTTPLLLAWRRPLIVMPRQLIDDLSPQQLRGIVAHELAHLSRRDHWANLFVFIVKLLLWWNPVIWWAERELRVAQELCCDAIAIDHSGANRHGYATTLLKALDFIQQEPLVPHALASGMGSRVSILRRFKMIGETQLSYQLSRWTLLILLAVAIPMVCIPVRAEEEKPVVVETSTTSDAGTAKTAVDAGNKKEDVGKSIGTNATRTDNPKVWTMMQSMRSDSIKVGLGRYSVRGKLDWIERGKDFAYDETLATITLLREIPLEEDSWMFVSGVPAERGRFLFHSELTKGEVKVILGDRLLKEGVGYEVDYEQGIVTIIDKAIEKKGAKYYISAGGRSMGNRPAQAIMQKILGKTEQVVGKRPQGKCSISGKVVSEETGKPVENARMYLHYSGTHGSIFIHTAADGTFLFKDIPKGPFSVQSSDTTGYQNVAYNPDGKPIPYPHFSLKDGEHRSGIVLKAKRAYQISGKITDENGKIPENIDTLHVLGWFEEDDGKKYRSEQARVNRADGSYLLDYLSDKPVYVMVIDWQAAKKGNAHPPIYYPGTFSRSDAKQITFGEKRSVDNINITLQKEGGLILEGTVLDDAGKPVPEAFVVVHRRDMLFDFVTAYTDEKGHYQIQGLGDGEFLVHVDAVHRGLVRTRTPIDLDSASKKTQQDFTLARGVTISGKFVDEESNDWQINSSYGHANIANIKDQHGPSSAFSLTNFRNKHRPKNVSRRGSGGAFSRGEGDYHHSQMLFPTKSTFLIQGMKPGHTTIGFSPKKEGQKVVIILHDGQDIIKSGIETKPGQEIKDVTIVIETQ